MYKKLLRSAAFTVVLALAVLAINVISTTPAQAAADTCTWTGAGGNTSASNSGNWTGCDNGGVPEADDNLVFPNGPANKTVLYDIEVRPVDISISGDDYTFNENFPVFINLNGDLAISGDNTTINPDIFFDHSTDVTFTHSGSGTDINGKIVLDSSAVDADMTFDITSDLSLPELDGYFNPGKLTKTGSGKLTITSGGSNFGVPKGVEINDGTWECAAVNCFGRSDNDVTVNGDSAAIRLVNGTSTVANDFTLSGNNPAGSLQSVDSSHTLSGTVTLDGDSTITSSGTFHTLELTGVLAGTGNLTYNGVDTGFGGYTLRLDGANPNTYDGSLTVNGGRLYLYKNGAISGDLILNATQTSDAAIQIDPSLDDLIADTAVVTLNNRGANSAYFSLPSDETIGGISGDGKFDYTTDQSASRLTLNVSDDQTFTGDIEVGTLVKTGSGTQTIAGILAGLNVNLVEGNLVFNGVSNSLFTVSEGATLKGTGTVGDMMINGTLAPGNSPGCINVTDTLPDATGNLDVTGGDFGIELSGTTACSGYDQVIATNTATLGGVNLNLNLGFAPTIGDTFTILRADTVTGTFADLDDGDTVTVDGVDFRINYSLSATGEDTVTLTVLTASTDETAGGGTGTDADAPNTGLAQQNMWIFAAALVVGGGLLIGLITPLRRKVYGFFKKAS